MEPIETRRRTKRGTVIDVSSTASPVLHADGVVTAVSIVARDITERKRSERELEHRREILQQAEAIAQMGSWEWNLATDHLTLSPGVDDILNLNTKALSVSTDDEAALESKLTQLVHPDGRQPVREALQRTVSELTSVSIQTRAIRADGRIRLLDWQADTIVDAHGKPLKVIGVVRDITETKRSPAPQDASASDLRQPRAGATTARSSARPRPGPSWAQPAATRGPTACRSRIDQRQDRQAAVHLGRHSQVPRQTDPAQNQHG